MQLLVVVIYFFVNIVFVLTFASNILDEIYTNLICGFCYNLLVFVVCKFIIGFASQQKQEEQADYLFAKINNSFKIVLLYSQWELLTLFCVLIARTYCGYKNNGSYWFSSLSGIITNGNNLSEVCVYDFVSEYSIFVYTVFLLLSVFGLYVFVMRIYNFISITFYTVSFFVTE